MLPLYLLVDIFFFVLLEWMHVLYSIVQSIICSLSSEG